MFIEQVADQELKDIPGSPVRPMKIFEAGYDGSVCPQRPDQAQHSIEDPTSRFAVQLRGGSCEPRQAGKRGLIKQPPRLTAANLADQIDKRRERERLAADLHATPEKRRNARPCRSLADKAGLADTGLTAHQQHGGRSVARALDGPRELGELYVAIHEPARTDLLHRHPVSRPADTASWY
jgi:hypothetical protein